jgi:predicted CoA-binding protein
MTDQELIALFYSVKTIAVVGLSDNPEKPAFHIAAYLKDKGYKIAPINPGCSQVLGEKCYPALEDVPFPVDLVDVFRRSEFAPEIARSAVRIGARALWLQDEVISPEAEKIASDAGLIFRQNDCIFRQRTRLFGI